MENIPQLVKETGAGLLVTDFAPLRLGRQWRDTVSVAQSKRDAKRRSLYLYCAPWGLAWRLSGTPEAAGRLVQLGWVCYKELGRRWGA